MVYLMVICFPMHKGSMRENTLFRKLDVGVWKGEVTRLQLPFSWVGKKKKKKKKLHLFLVYGLEGERKKKREQKKK